MGQKHLRLGVRLYNRKKKTDVEGQNAIPGKKNGETKMMWAIKSPDTRLTNLDSESESRKGIFFSVEK